MRILMLLISMLFVVSETFASSSVSTADTTAGTTVTVRVGARNAARTKTCRVGSPVGGGSPNSDCDDIANERCCKKRVKKEATYDQVTVSGGYGFRYDCDSDDCDDKGSENTAATVENVSCGDTDSGYHQTFNRVSE